MLEKLNSKPDEKIFENLYSAFFKAVKTKLTKHAYEAGINPIWRPVHRCIDLSVNKNLYEHVKDYEFEI
jgi:hypothetical protein